MTEDSDRHEVQEIGAKGILQFELEEMLLAFEESFHDLSNEQAHAFPFQGEFNVAWCVMHCIENHNWYLVESQGGERLLPDDWDSTRWYYLSPMPMPDQEFPSVEEMKGLSKSIRESAMHLLQSATEEDLDGKRHACAEERSKASYLRMLEHTNVHVRWIWQIRGALGLRKRAIQR